MRKLAAALAAAALLAAAVAAPVSAAKPDDFDNNGNVIHSVSSAGFDQYGYNYTAMLFSGKADGVDRVLDGNVWGDPTYANDYLVMKWSKGWDDARFHGAPWTTDAWETNEWNGAMPGGTGEVWHYKIQWVGLDPNAQPWANGYQFPDGGYAIWGQFEVIMDQGVSDTAYCDANGGGHQFCTLATPNGFGS